MKEIQLSNWAEFKEICIVKKKLSIQCLKNVDKDYHVFAVEGRLYWFMNLSVDADIKDFEKNYLKKSNYRIEDK